MTANKGLQSSSYVSCSLDRLASREAEPEGSSLCTVSSWTAVAATWKLDWAGWSVFSAQPHLAKAHHALTRSPHSA